MQKYKTVNEFLEDLDDEKKSQVLVIRTYIKEAEPILVEHIKWNAPSYTYNQNDRLTFNLMNKENLVKLVFHMGALQKENKNAAPILDDKFSLIEWVSDVRGYITFKDYDDAISKHEAIKWLTSKWIAIGQ